MRGSLYPRAFIWVSTAVNQVDMRTILFRHADSCMVLVYRPKQVSKTKIPSNIHTQVGLGVHGIYVESSLVDEGDLEKTSPLHG